MSTIRNYVERLQVDVLVSIIKDYEGMESSGGIPDDSKLREVYTDFMKNTGVTDNVPIITMDQMVKEAYRIFAYRYIDLISK